MTVNAVSLFCEDVRQEANGQEIIIGIFKDKLFVNILPGMLPKLSVYTRINIPNDLDIQNLGVYLVSSIGENIVENKIDMGLIKSNKNIAIESGTPYTGITSRVTLSPFSVEEPKSLIVNVVADLQTIVSGVLHIELAPS